MFARGTRARRIVAAVFPPLLFAIFVIGAWQLYTVIGDVKESTLPPPTAIAEALWNDRSMLIENAWVTIKEILLGFAAAIVLGVGLAVLIRSSRTIERAVYPWLVVSQMVPIPAIAPLLIIWFGFEIEPKVIVIMLVSFFPIAVNT
ncbi:MAG TPA: ABC transporter permease, partial [Solirubrobacterales bacterium]|nr:ABC transporter permease [Solirubrobacterales bacterium]